LLVRVVDPADAAEELDAGARCWTTCAASCAAV
jgi:hypothetical protein